MLSIRSNTVPGTERQPIRDLKDDVRCIFAPVTPHGALLYTNLKGQSSDLPESKHGGRTPYTPPLDSFGLLFQAF